MVRWSRWGPFPHVLCAERRRTGTLRMVSYKPTAPLVFDGESKWGDL